MPRRIWKGRDRLTSVGADQLAAAAADLERALADRRAAFVARFSLPHVAGRRA